MKKIIILLILLSSVMAEERLSLSEMCSNYISLYPEKVSMVKIKYFTTTNNNVVITNSEYSPKSINHLYRMQTDYFFEIIKLKIMLRNLNSRVSNLENAPQ